MPEISAASVLPALREPVDLWTGDGLRLVGELALPPADPGAGGAAAGGPGAAAGTLVCVHPLPTAGGMMDSHVLRKAAWRLPALAGIAVLRFNTRGTSSAAGRSEGEFDGGDAEGLDLAAALDLVAARALPRPWLLGWSFGTDVVLRHGAALDVAGAVLLSPPLRFSRDADLDAWAASGRPLEVLVPEHDDYLRPAEAAVRFARVPQAHVVAVPGGRHLWVGERYVRLALDAAAAAVVPGAVPLPGEYDGPMERWSDL